MREIAHVNGLPVEEHLRPSLPRYSWGPGWHGRGSAPACSMVQTAALIEPAYVLEIEADAVIG